jgi:DNA-binding LacI/PurR family transcriptional regulator
MRRNDLVALFRETGDHVGIVGGNDHRCLQFIDFLKERKILDESSMNFISIDGCFDFAHEDGREAVVKIDLEAMAEETAALFITTLEQGPNGPRRILVGSQIIENKRR